MAFVQIKDKAGNIVGNKTTNIIGSYDYIDIDEPNLWWPYLMHTQHGYLYTLEVSISYHKTLKIHYKNYYSLIQIQLQTVDEEVIDVYRLKTGIRTLSWNSTQFLINGKPIYFRGFGKHEDSDVFYK